MKNTNQDRQLPPSAQNRLNKTQQQPPPKPDYLDNTYQAQKKTTMYNEKPSALPPRTGSTQKINYKIEQNMTNSKIQEAKQGLQLLKKKMSRNGMSRQKNERNSSMQKRGEDLNPMKKTSYKQQREEYYELKQQIKKQTPKVVDRRNQKEDTYKKSPPIPTKSMQDKPIKRQSQRQQIFNPNQEIPIKGNQDFMAILQRQMAKEKAGNQPQTKAPINKPVQKQVIQQDEDVQLAECSKGCGRKFNINTLQKHQKICEKVFQSKRKVFNSAEFRQPEAQGEFKKPPPIPATIKEEKPKPRQAASNKQQKIPKWKLQSAAFRAGLKQGRGQKLSAEEKAVAQQASGMIQCGSCGRKFNETAGKRHIAFCQNKAKQMPKMNTTATKRK